MKLLFVCTANVCRSPLAEGYFKSLIGAEESSKFEASSAGIAAFANSSAFDCSVEVAKLHGFDISQHRARRLTRQIAAENDMILCMESWQASSILDLNPDLLSKVALLGRYHPGKGPIFQIPDPREFNVSCTQDVFRLIRPSVENLLKTLKG